ATLAIESFRRSPNRSAKLIFDKPLRLFKFPCNDFRVSMGPITVEQQVWFHQLIVALSLIAIPFLLSRSADENAGNVPRRRSELFLLGTLLCALPYSFFITCPRYNLPFMPIAIMFAAFACAELRRAYTQASHKPLLLGLASLMLLVAASNISVLPLLVAAGIAPTAAIILLCLVKTGLFGAVVYGLCRTIRRMYPRNAAPYVVTCVLAVLTFPLLCLPLRAHGRWFEWRAPFAGTGAAIEQTIAVPPDAWERARCRQCYLIADADGVRSLSGCRIMINGIEQSGPVVPGLGAVQDYRFLKGSNGTQFFWEGEYIFSCMTQLCGMNNSDLRQWLMIPIDARVFA
ncbi:MAG: hypothetical protein ACRD3W_23200, partial [Terriglobales bacterium]